MYFKFSDLDAVFAVIWRTLRKQEVLTLDCYVEHLQHVFKVDGMKTVQVDTPMLIPAYDSWIAPAIDTKLGRLHKDIQTQHCWRFEAVDRCDSFPSGCKTTYKAYSSDVIVEIRRVSKTLAQTPIGKHVELEAYKVYNTWQPEPVGQNKIEGREGIEGFYLLAHIDLLNWTTNGPKVDTLHEGSMARLRQTITAVRKDPAVFPANSEKRKTWDEWQHKFVLPKVESDRCASLEEETQKYISHLMRRGEAYRSPLKHILFLEGSENHARQWELADAKRNLNPDFYSQIPYVLQVAMNSVRTEINPVPHMPRFTAETDVALFNNIQSFEEKLQPYYSSLKISRDFTNDTLKNKIRRFVSYDACVYRYIYISWIVTYFCLN